MARSSIGRTGGFDPLGCRFESCRAIQKGRTKGKMKTITKTEKFTEGDKEVTIITVETFPDYNINQQLYYPYGWPYNGYWFGGAWYPYTTGITQSPITQYQGEQTNSYFSVQSGEHGT